ncbi:hypothetical protein V6N12_038257 [Hibiscus sabdariffa]|uniref:Uncharacterized protein n=1 Tax=Hibiscus sabdariffa TaxID=183260 RepID=A0ABR2BX02_9ROSI
MMATDAVQQASEHPTDVVADSDTNTSSQPAMSDQTELVVPRAVVSHSDQPNCPASPGLLADEVLSDVSAQAASELLPSEPLVTDQVTSIIQQPESANSDQVDQVDLAASTMTNNRHGMTTRSKSGIFKPKVYHTEGQTDMLLAVSGSSG